MKQNSSGFWKDLTLSFFYNLLEPLNNSILDGPVYEQKDYIFSCFCKVQQRVNPILRSTRLNQHYDGFFFFKCYFLSLMGYFSNPDLADDYVVLWDLWFMYSGYFITKTCVVSTF